VTGRKKDLLVLSNGKKVVPAHVEGLLMADPCVDQVVVCGEGRNFLAALIVPNWPVLRKEAGVANGQVEAELARDPKSGRVLEGAGAAGASPTCRPWEQVKRFTVLARPFSCRRRRDDGELKLRRGVIFKHHAGEIEALYRMRRTWARSAEPPP